MNPQIYCQKKAAKSGSSFYYSFLSLPKPQKDAMVALYAYCREVDDVVDEVSEFRVAQQKLAWWQQETKRFFEGTPQHPITQALKKHRALYTWPSTLFQDLLRGMTTDLKGPHFESFDELEDYCYCVAGTVGQMATHVFGYHHEQTLLYAKHLGTSLQLINIIRDLGEDLRRGRIYLPQEDLDYFDIKRERLLALDYRDEDLKPLLRYQAQRARQFYDEALKLLPSSDRVHQKAGLVMAAIYLHLLKVIEEEHFAVLNQKIKLTPFKKIWIAWRTLRKEKKLKS